jgi:hypothetical protein
LLVGLQVLARGHYQTHSIYLFLANIVNFSPERAMASSTDILKQCNSQVILPLDQKKEVILPCYLSKNGIAHK